MSGVPGDDKSDAGGHERTSREDFRAQVQSRKADLERQFEASKAQFDQAQEKIQARTGRNLILAIIIGLAASAVVWAAWYTLPRYVWPFNKVDDALGVIYTHGIAGLLGGLLVGFLADPNVLEYPAAPGGARAWKSISLRKMTRSMRCGGAFLRSGRSEGKAMFSKMA